MDEGSPRSLGRRDEELADVLMALGLSRPEARALVLLSREGAEVSSPDVVEAAGLRQPEVSAAMQALAARGWVERREVRSGRRGRPMHRYRLVVPLEGAVAEIEEGKRAEIARAEQLLERMRRLAKA